MSIFWRFARGYFTTGVSYSVTPLPNHIYGDRAIPYAPLDPTRPPQLSFGSVSLPEAGRRHPYGPAQVSSPRWPSARLFHSLTVRGRGPYRKGKTAVDITTRD